MTARLAPLPAPEELKPARSGAAARAPAWGLHVCAGVQSMVRI